MLDGDVTYEIEQMWMDHIDVCDRCRTLYATLVQTEDRFVGLVPVMPRETLPSRWQGGKECPTAEHLLLLLSDRATQVQKIELETHLGKCDSCLHDVLMWQKQQLSVENPSPNLEATPGWAGGKQITDLLTIVVKLGEDALELISQTGQLIGQRPVVVRKKVADRQPDDQPAVIVRKDDIRTNLSFQVNVVKSPGLPMCDVQISVLDLLDELPASDVVVELVKDARLVFQSRTDEEGLLTYGGLEPASYSIVVRKGAYVCPIVVEIGE